MRYKYPTVIDVKTEQVVVTKLKTAETRELVVPDPMYMGAEASEIVVLELSVTMNCLNDKVRKVWPEELLMSMRRARFVRIIKTFWSLASLFY